MIQKGSEDREEISEIDGKPSWFDEYKIVVEDTARLVERRYSVINGFIGANFSVLVTSGALLIAESISLLIRTEFLVLLMFLGLALNYYWFRFLKVSVDATDYRYSVLEKIEQEMGSNVMLYNLEKDRAHTEEMVRPLTLKKLFPLLPVFFLAFYGIALVLILIAVVAGQLN